MRILWERAFGRFDERFEHSAALYRLLARRLTLKPPHPLCAQACDPAGGVWIANKGDIVPQAGYGAVVTGDTAHRHPGRRVLLDWGKRRLNATPLPATHCRGARSRAEGNACSAP